ncbi:MAG TPA: toluene tolerance protein [Pseudomonadales bacterium]|nr:toluene tolerance protein [Pseudomonadales bacterium]
MTLPRRQACSDACLDRLLADATIVEAGTPRPRVARLADGTLLKGFRHRRGWQRHWRRSRARAFIANAAELRRRGFLAPAPSSWLRGPDGIEYVRYEPLPGHDLRQIDAPAAVTVTSLVDLLLRLHDAGVLFRALHLGNVVLQTDGALALIDVSDVRFRRRPLGAHARGRNFTHLLRYPQDRRWLAASGCDPQRVYLDRLADRPALARALARRFGS